MPAVLKINISTDPEEQDAPQHAPVFDEQTSNIKDADDPNNEFDVGVAPPDESITKSQPPDGDEDLKQEKVDAEPLPYGRPDPSKIKTLFDPLRVSLPEVPSTYDPERLGETKKVTETEVTLHPDDQLKKVVYVPDLVTQLYEHAAESLRRVTID
ncbi:hypothetical protein B0H21DRAFT_824883 [Amylocystis lapponica]|nr:hypothetical protein B0H21DRAFT_824883 [Amylocystis lapponica]